jgi:hypothetical protein
MKQLRSRIISLLLVVVLLAMFPLSAFAAGHHKAYHVKHHRNKYKITKITAYLSNYEGSM